jgi:UDP-2-acetamido-3-amino-2,3-dideoxy-glucuronate N-acetyltransferase
VSDTVHPTAIVNTSDLGSRCIVREYASVDSGVSLGDDVEVGAGARILHGVRLDRSATVGANATVLRGAAVGRGAVVAPGSVVENDVPAWAIVRGSPARIVGYVDSPGQPEPQVEEKVAAPETAMPTLVPGVVLHPLRHARDLRGSLAALEFEMLPFVPRRIFAVYAVPDESVRGAHAHRACAQFLVCVSGAVSAVADDGRARQEFRLTGPTVGLLIPPLVWSMQYRYSSDAVLVVLAELSYDPQDYIRDYEEFLQIVASGR